MIEFLFVNVLRYFLLSFLLITATLGASADSFLSPEERAYLFHVVKKSPVLDRNMGHLFEYRGDTVYYRDSIDYDSLEQMIILEPSLLSIKYNELSKMPPGILAETSTKMALWKLHKDLMVPDESEYLPKLVESIEKYAPENALKEKGNEWFLKKDLYELFDPLMPFREKMNLLIEMKELSVRDQEVLLDLVSQHIEKLAVKLSRDIYLKLGGRFERMENYLIAAGDGSGTSGLLREVEDDEDGRPDNKLPVGVGLFNYEFERGRDNAGNRAITIKKDPVVAFNYYLGSSSTTLHLSIWGFNSFFQTTVAISNGDRDYLLFANKYTRELNPDSTFGQGKTLFGHIKTLEEEMIPEVREKLYSEGGYVARLKVAKKKEREALTSTRRSEAELRKLGLMNNRKKYKKVREEFLHYSNLYEQRKTKRRELEVEMIAEKYHLAYLEDQLYYLKAILGDNPIPFERKDSLFIFEDGSRFNAYTQDFEFANIEKDKPVLVRLISVGSKPLSNRVDEVQLFVGMHEKPENERFETSLDLTDVFEPDEYILKDWQPSAENQQKVDELARFLINNQAAITLSLEGYGIGVIKDNELVQAEDDDAEELKAYPGRDGSSRNEPRFRDLRRTRISIRNSSSLTFQVESFTDPVRSGLFADTLFDSIRTIYPDLTGNQLLSALRSAGMILALEDLLTERIASLAGENFVDASKAIDVIDNVLEKAWIRVGDHSIPFSSIRYLFEPRNSSSGNPNK